MSEDDVIKERLAFYRAGFIVFGGTGLIGGSYIAYQSKGWGWVVAPLALMSGIIAMVLIHGHQREIKKLR